jgi:hypothetical protein
VERGKAEPDYTNPDFQPRDEGRKLVEERAKSPHDA